MRKVHIGTEFYKDLLFGNETNILVAQEEVAICEDINRL